MRGARRLAMCALLAAMVGCGPKGNPELEAQRKSSYQRLAIVCVPSNEADPKFVNVIMPQVRARAQKWLPFLSEVHFPENVSVNVDTKPPKVTVGPETSAYDAVAVLVYSYSGGMVYLDINMIDATSGEDLWHYPIATKDPYTRGRLLAHGYWAPPKIKLFYRGF